MSDNCQDLRKASLEQLQEAGLVSRLIPDEEKESFELLWELHEDESSLEVIEGNFPQFLTEAGKKAIDRMWNDSLPEVVLDGLQARTPDEKPATSQQINFLKYRFRIDEAALNALGEWQARAAIKQILEFFGNRSESRPSTAMENSWSDVGAFKFATRRKNSIESLYGLWTTHGNMPGIQGPFDKPRCLEWLATHLQDPKETRIVHIAKDGELVEGAERADLISEAAGIAADWVTKRG
jgi:hypothetical protein